MTTYVYRPAVAAIPAPVSNGSGSGNTSISVWGAGIFPVTYPIRLIKVELTADTTVYRVDSAVVHNSSFAPALVPVNMRQGGQTCSATTAMGTSTTNLSGSSYSYSVSGAIPGGTFNYLGVAKKDNYTFASDVIVKPGSALWFGSNYTAFVGSISTTSVVFADGALGGTSVNNGYSAPAKQTAGLIYFEELHLARST